MNFVIINRNTGGVSEMFFETTKHLSIWLSKNQNFDSLGEVEYELPTRHARMKNK